jgi:hypothetical protein
MRVLRAFAIALITGIAAAALVIPVSDYLTQLYHVSNMEGQRGMLIMFGIAPLTTLVADKKIEKQNTPLGRTVNASCE